MDGDGSDAIACGGDDCDDDDNNRFPGNDEVCDAAGHDEDCVDTTVGETDVDTDGFVDAMCCNTVYGTCGDDCDDGDINVNPGASETCNGADDDCDVDIDESSTSLCPGGVCAAGRCDFTGWDRTFGGGGSGTDDASAVAMDATGNVCVAGTFHGTTRFGGPASPERTALARTDAFVACYSSSGGYIWDRTFGGAGFDRGQAITIIGGTVVLGGTFVDSITIETDVHTASGLGSFLVALDMTDGSHVWNRGFGARVAGLSGNASSVTAVGYFEGTTNFGGGDVTSMTE